MHGTYRGLEYNSELYVFTRLDDVEALVASFPSYPLFEYAPRRTMPQRLVMQIVPCAMACAIAGATQIDTGSRPGISSSHNEVASALVPAPNAPELAARPQRPTPGVTVQRQPVPVSSGSTGRAGGGCRTRTVVDVACRSCVFRAGASRDVHTPGRTGARQRRRQDRTCRDGRWRPCRKHRLLRREPGGQRAAWIIAVRTGKPLRCT